MEYYKILKLNREPFSNSPDPDFFYQAAHHVECMQKTELAVRLRRGLNVVIGEVGTGKTTLCRQLIRRFSEDKKINAHLLLDPHFSKPIEFLRTVDRMFGISQKGEQDITEWRLRENIKNYLFEQGVNKDKVIVLIIDEGQKIPDFCMELLREFLNYETNEYKLLQIIIFAQKEFKSNLKRHPGFTDRINLYYDLGPLSLRDTRLMIRYRLNRASEGGKSAVRFSRLATRAIYEASGGFPRKIVKLCHQIVLKLIIKSRTRAGYFIVRSYLKASEPASGGRFPLMKTVGLTAVIAIAALSALVYLKIIPGNLTHLWPSPMKKEAVLPSEQTSTVEDKAVETVVEQPILLATYPSLLGRVPAVQDLTVWKMIEDIYGYSDLDHLNRVKAANPQIGDFDNVEPGTEIIFPAIPEKGAAQGGWNLRVQIAEGKTLDEIYRSYREYAKTFPHIRIMSYWNPLGGLKFSIILKRGFENEGVGRAAMAKLPPSLSSLARIVSHWDEDTVLFSGGLMETQTPG